MSYTEKVLKKKDSNSHYYYYSYGWEMRWLAPLFLIFVPFFSGVLVVFIRLYNCLCCLEGPGGEWNQFSSLPSNSLKKETSLWHWYLLAGSSLAGSQVLLFSPITQTDRNICVFSSGLFPFSLWSGVSKLKRFRGAYNSDLWAHCVGHHFRNLALRKNFKGTNLNLFEECFRMSQRSQYVCAENRPENIHKNLI